MNQWFAIAVGAGERSAFIRIRGKMRLLFKRLIFLRDFGESQMSGVRLRW